ncbi:lytic transglycosylase domain-containing protein [Nocardioides sp. zg-536]|uniref:Lytic transglycosylase domain-containing protein n=1 Tax=Nocardioides faecalis TaxID=2803858 RepID=A0A938Y7V1_9ACTN|nr:lytic transglycosylase domain-containing protein [Nocardioides faecalis]MBM9459788.1 lytic transglycosylase domain-containing protein [Nocardioides faecalis]MBS4753434.1 lytic transglycosylase domain-containing protein [Nocardioides faecalis]QVI58300.1 lytic transglycosylase domain-containing protein [Nocardioides faecalis]
MSKHAKPVPKHRGTPKHAHLAEAPRKAARNALVLSSVAAAVTGVSVAAGTLGKDAAAPAAATRAEMKSFTVDTPAADAGKAVEERREVVSRSDRRPAADPAKAATLVESDPAALTDARKLSDSDPRDIARALMGEFNFSASQFGCLDSLWTRESNWRWNADNPSSSAYGIPQALPGSKMSSAGADWATNPATQIRWGLGYIKDRYGSPCSAWGHSESHGWY